MIFNKTYLKKRISGILIVSVMALSMTFFSDSTYCAAAGSGQVYLDDGDDSTSDTRERMEAAQQAMQEKQAELLAAQGQVATTQASIDALSDVKDTYEGQMYTLNAELQLVADNLAVIEAQLDIKNLELEETTIALEEATRLRDSQYEAMKQRIRYMYEGADNTYIDIILSADTFAEFLNYADYVEALSAYDRKQLEEYIATQNSISENKALIEQELAEIEALEAEAIAQQQQVNGLIDETASYIASTESSISTMEAEKQAYEAACDQKQAEAAQAQADYESIKAQYEEELRLAEAARAAAWRDISQVTFEDGDLKLLANLIYCEAGGEPYDGQLAVGAVVINRVMASKYPDTVTGVIYQYKQFSPVLDGHLAAALAADKATASCYQAAEQAMEGMTNVGTCLYFRTPIEGLVGIQIGHHIFY